MKLFEPVVAYWPSIKVTLPAIDPEVEANEEDTVEEVASRLVTLVDNDPEVVLKLVSAVVNLVLKEADCAANEADAFVKVVILVSFVVTLVLNEAEDAAYDPEVITYDPEVMTYDPEVITYDPEVKV